MNVDGEYSDYNVTINDSEAIVNVKSTLGGFSVTLCSDIVIADNNTENELIEFVRRFQGDNVLKLELYELILKNANSADFMCYLSATELDEDVRNVIVELITADK